MSGIVLDNKNMRNCTWVQMHRYWWQVIGGNPWLGETVEDMDARWIPTLCRSLPELLAGFYLLENGHWWICLRLGISLINKDLLIWRVWIPYRKHLFIKFKCLQAKEKCYTCVWQERKWEPKLTSKIGKIAINGMQPFQVCKQANLQQEWCQDV